MTAQKTQRSHTCGELSKANIGQSVSLCGWVHTRRDHGGVIFIDLRDRYGLSQVVFDPQVEKKVHEKAGVLRSEFVIWCQGTVRPRPEGMINSRMKTGEVEVAVTELVIFNEAKTPPFPLNEETEVSENVRLKYRYLDLRRSALQKNFMIRHQAITTARNVLNENGFLEIETPILYKSTPEGARDFVVPSRLNPGNFYALPQSPQTLKQLLMIGGFDRYYQIARCFRDEDLRADRQPEFSQIDIEASFLDEKSFTQMIEKLVSRIWDEVHGIKLKMPIPVYSYYDVMNRYGVDRPDIRFELELIDIKSIFAKSEFKVFSSVGDQGAMKAIVVRGQAETLSRKDLDDLTKEATKMGAKGLLWIKIQAGNEMQSPAAKFFSEDEKKNLISKLDLKQKDVVLIVADSSWKKTCVSLGSVRSALGRRLKLIPEIGSAEERNNPAFLWVNRFPLFEYNEQDGRYYACHHPFTRPIDEHVDDLIAGKNLDQIEAYAYDLVLNGHEVAGGSLRIYRPDVQAALFRTIGMSEEQAKEKFGFFLEALTYGTPPHGGIAFGIERLTGVLAGVGPIRDVMAFPKTQKGHCMMSESPSRIDPEQLVELGLSVKNAKA